MGNTARRPNLNVSTIRWPSTGLFTWQSAYGIVDCVDGTSSTIAFSEAAIGYQSETPLQKLIGLQNVQIPYSSMLNDASADSATVLSVFQLCNAAYQSGSKNFIDLH